MLLQYSAVFVFICFSILFLVITMLMSRLIRPNNPYDDKQTTYECGEEPVGNARIRFNFRFYVIALIFVIFDVEIVLLFPWAVVFRELGLIAFVEMAIFLLILFVGFAYVWNKGDLDWIKPKMPHTMNSGEN